MLISNNDSIEKSLEIRKKNRNVFVYKIIHDLRHPTQALTNAIEQQLKEIESVLSNGIFTAYRVRSDGKIRISRNFRNLRRFIEPSH